MKQVKLIFILLFASIVYSQAEYTILEVPILPGKSSREMYEEQGMYLQKLMEYYTIAANYEMFIKSNGLEPIKKVPIPSQEQFEEADFKTITLYYNLCVELQKQYKDNSLNFRDKEMDNLILQLKEARKYALEMQTKMNKTILENSYIDFYRENNKDLLIDLTEFMYENDSLQMAVYTAKKEMYKSLKHRRGLGANKYPVLTGKVGSVQHFLYSGLTDVKTGVQAAIVFNPGPVLGIGEYFDIFCESNFYNVATGYNEAKVQNMSYGFDLVLPFSKLVKFSQFGIEAKFGVGFFSSKATAPNTSLEASSWHGQLMRFEIDFFNFGGKFPIGIYSNYSLYNNRSDIIFPIAEDSNLNIGNNWTSAFVLGLSFPIWNISE